MIILASESWLRKLILQSSGMEFIVKGADVDERAIEEQNADKSDEEVAMLLAQAKSEAIAHDNKTDVVIAADTFAILPNGIRLHKPNSPQEAVDLCMMQSGQAIRVVTGIAMKCADQTLVKTSATIIHTSSLIGRLSSTC